MLSPRIETDRLVLRRYIENDIDGIYDLITDKRLQTYIKYPKLTKDEELENIRKWIENYDIDKKEKWVIVLKETNEVIGNVQVNDINKKNNYCNIGYGIRYNYQGMGFATEAVTHISNYLLESGYYLIEASINELNIGSRRVLEKSGFIKDGYIANRRINDDGTYSAVEYYSKKERIE